MFVRSVWQNLFATFEYWK